MHTAKLAACALHGQSRRRRVTPGNKCTFNCATAPFVRALFCTLGIGERGKARWSVPRVRCTKCTCPDPCLHIVNIDDEHLIAAVV